MLRPYCVDISTYNVVNVGNNDDNVASPIATIEV